MHTQNLPSTPEMTKGPPEHQTSGARNKDNTTTLFHRRNYLKHPCYGFGGLDDPLIMVVGPWEQLLIITEAAARSPQDEFANHPSLAVSMI